MAPAPPLPAVTASAAPTPPTATISCRLLRELCTRYDVDGVRIDMTFWYNVCYCRHCRQRYAEEVGGEPPRTVDWCDPTWVGFQRKREEWLLDYASLLTGTIKDINPDISVEHQCSTMPLGWVTGVTWPLADRMDFLQGDFYGGVLQGSFINKLLYSLTPNRPFGFETSSSPQLFDHTGLKSYPLVRARAFAAVANGGAFVFIDQIDPDGTVNPRPYQRIAPLYHELAGYEPYLGGDMVQEVAVYFSTVSKIDTADNGRDVLELGNLRPRIPHVQAAMAAVQVLQEAHIGFGVITKRSLAALADYQLVILPDVTMLDEEEVAALRAYVAAGGSLYASGTTSLLRADGVLQDDFMLGDLFGVTCTGTTEHQVTYFVPAPEGAELMAGWSAEHPSFLPEAQCRVSLRSTESEAEAATVLATLGTPYTLSGELRRFASVHNNPPDKDFPATHPALVEHRFGAGRVIYAAGVLERYPENRDLFTALIRRLVPSPRLTVAAPPAIESTLFHDREARRYRVQDRVTAVRVLPQGTPIPWDQSEGLLSFAAPTVETFAMVGVGYE